MGTLTRLQMRGEVDKNLGKVLANLTGADLTEAQDRIHRALALSQVRVARAYDFEELKISDSDSIAVTGTPSTDQYYSGMPATLRKVFSLRRQIGTDRSVKLVYWPTRTWDQLIGAAAQVSTGDARLYTVWRDSGGAHRLEWYPVPSQNWTLLRRYSVWPALLPADGSFSTLDNKDDLLIAWTTEWMFGSMGEHEDRKTWKETRMELMRDAKLDDMSKPDVSHLPRGGSDEVDVSPDYWVDPFVRRAP